MLPRYLETPYGPRSGRVLRDVVVGCFLATTIVFVDSLPACAETRLTAHYAISIAGVGIGEGTWKVEIDKTRYSTRADGAFTGIWRLLAGGDVYSQTRGSVIRSGLAPTQYEANFALDEAIDEVRMELRDGAVTRLDVTPPLPEVADRVPMTEAHRRGVVDPLTAGLVPAPAAGDILAPAACERTLAMFDGGHRFDMALAFKRMDAAKTEPGYGGPVVVCGMTYRPISGHSPTGWRVKHLIGREGMEMWFAPLGGARLLAMYRISIPTMVGTAVLSATRFEAAAGR